MPVGAVMRIFRAIVRFVRDIIDGVKIGIAYSGMGGRR
jgi:hypothetical protein